MSYIPDPDAQFDTWQTQYATYLNANLAALGLPVVPPDPDVTALNTARTDWQTKYPAHIAAQDAAQAARQAKDASRAAYEEVIRRLTQRLQTSGAVDDAERAALGITIPDREPTPVGAPTTKPVLQADTSQRLRITISFADEGTPTNRAKPAGVSGCEIWVKLGGAPPTDLSECQYLATDTPKVPPSAARETKSGRTPYTATFDGSEANQTAHFPDSLRSLPFGGIFDIGRWVSTRGEPGPLSETLSATVPG